MFVLIKVIIYYKITGLNILENECNTYLWNVFDECYGQLDI